jgi:FkbM family methyltransferase
MFRRIEKIINQSQMYNLLRYAALSDYFVEKITGDKSKAKKFYRGFLTDRSDRLVFDVGANKGNKVQALLELGYQVIAVEPEKKSLKTLHWRFSGNKKVRIVEKGLSDQPGSTNIFIAEPRSGFNTLSNKWVDILGKSDVNRFEKKIEYQDSYEITLTTLDELIRQFGLPYFIKIDVEGYENNVIRGLNQVPDFLSFETNLPEFLEETLECIAHLRKLSPGISFNYSIAENLEESNWVSAEALIKIVTGSSLRYMEIVCRMR